MNQAEELLRGIENKNTCKPDILGIWKESPKGTCSSASSSQSQAEKVAFKEWPSCFLAGVQGHLFVRFPPIVHIEASVLCACLTSG